MDRILRENSLAQELKIPTPEKTLFGGALSIIFFYFLHLWAELGMQSKSKITPYIGI